MPSSPAQLWWWAKNLYHMCRIVRLSYVFPDFFDFAYFQKEEVAVVLQYVALETLFVLVAGTLLVWIIRRAWRIARRVAAWWRTRRNRRNGPPH